MSGLKMDRVRKLLQQFDFANLFIEELGWDRYREQMPIELKGSTFLLDAVAEKRGLVVFLCSTPPGTDFLPYALRRKIERQVAKVRHEHLIIYVDQARTRQVWQWVKREAGRPDACREHTFHKGQPGDALIQKLTKLMVTLDEEEAISIVDMAGRTRAAFNVEKITKKFYELFKKEHTAFLKFVDGITDMGDKQWYASLMLNRLMFVYFIQKKGFLDNDLNYLRNRLQMMQQEKGKGKFYSFYRHFLLRLFHEGLGKKKEERNSELDRMLGKVPYLNGGLFDVHELEKEYHDIQICDDAFDRLFAFFEKYHWHLDERPLRLDNEINPDVLGYIFEKYINQKQMGAYYTKEDITEYISKNTIIPYLFDVTQKKCKIAFEGEQAVWNLLQKEPDRYIYEAVRKGCELPLPPEIESGLDTTKPDLLERRESWNKPAPAEFALPTEIWREVVARRKRYEEVHGKLVAGEVRSINDCITYNLNIRQFAQDVIENCEGPELLRAFWHAIVGRIHKKSNEKPESGITILDPTCGSGAFLFAALNILEPLYEACLDRMQSFVAELAQAEKKQHPDKFNDFRTELGRVSAHPNQSYFIMKSIILNNLYGVDIMAEAVEICKLRLFLKMVAQVERGDQIEPLPDIDFNIRCGNTLVGFATYDEVKEAVMTSRGATLLPGMDAGRMAKIEQKAQDLQQAFDIFRRRQVEGDGSVPPADKMRVRERLTGLEDELNRALAGKYGINYEKNRDAYTMWLTSHQPFHWFIEYYGIMAGGGFDVIIGNPPYVEYKDVKNQYQLHGYKTETCSNLFVYVLERCTKLSHSGSEVGMIVPLSAFSTDRMIPLIKHIKNTSTKLSVANFSWRPGKLFDGVNLQLSILLQKVGAQTEEVDTTRYLMWDSKARPELFSKIEYVRTHDSRLSGCIPKLGAAEASSILRKLRSHKKEIGGCFTSHSNNKVYYRRGGLYWKVFVDFMTDSSEEKIIHLLPEIDKYAIIAALSSDLWWWYFTITSDCRHLGNRDIKTFPLDPREMSSFQQKALSDLGKEYVEDLKRNAIDAVRVYKGKNSVECLSFRVNQSKPIIDEIDRVLAQHYGFTEEELDFIINYDIKYRMGLGSASVGKDV